VLLGEGVATVEVLASPNRVVCCVQTRTELGWNGHGDVIYKALEPLLYQREAAMVQPLVSCLITVLGKVEGGYIKNESNYQVRGKHKYCRGLYLSL
jgi:hypothetical protein